MSNRMIAAPACVLALLWVLTAAFASACGDGAPMPTNEAGFDARADGDDGGGSDIATDGPPGERCAASAECNDGMYCNGEERCSGGVCVPGNPPCEDHASCSTDLCDEAAQTCTHMLDDSMCGDHDACNGIEHCAPGTPGVDANTGCQRVVDSPIDCDDGNNCTIDTCDPSDPSGCVHSPRDIDGDGHIDRACTIDGTPTGIPGDDCNDGDPSAYPGAPEICDDGVDNDCNGSADYFDTRAMCVATNDACSSPRLLPGSGSYSSTTTGTTDNQRLSCNTVTGVPDAVFTFRLDSPADIRATVNATPTGAAIALASSCEPLMERRCGRTTTAGGSTAPPSVFARSLPAGTHYLIIEMPAGTGPYRFTLNIMPPTSSPAGDACPPLSPAVDLVSGVARTAAIPTLTDDFSLTCNPGLPVRDGVFHLNLTAARNVALQATSSAGTTYMSLRQGTCDSGTQLRCVAGTGTTGATTSVRSLPAGDYWVVVENDGERDVTVTATVTDPGMVATGDACRAPAIVPLSGPFPQTGSVTIDGAGLLAGADHGTSCGSRATPDGWRDAVAQFTLTSASDVTLTVNPTAGSATYFWALDAMCGLQSSEVGRCFSGAGTTPSVRRIYDLPAGTYAVILETTATPAPSFRVQVDTTDPALRPRYEACSGAPIALTGTATTLSGSIDINAAMPVLDRTAQQGTTCGSGGLPDGWTDIVFSYALPDRRNVTIDFTSTAAAFWYVEVDAMCGVHSSIVGGCSGGLTSPYRRTILNQAAGTYYIIAENAAPMQGNVHVAITATAP